MVLITNTVMGVVIMEKFRSNRRGSCVGRKKIVMLVLLAEATIQLEVSSMDSTEQEFFVFKFLPSARSFRFLLNSTDESAKLAYAPSLPSFSKVLSFFDECKFNKCILPSKSLEDVLI